MGTVKGRSRTYLGVALVAVALCCVGWGLGQWRRQETPPGVFLGRPPVFRPQVEPSLGVNVDLMSRQPEDIARVLDWVEDSGFRWVRQRFAWSTIERERGRLDWSQADAVLAEASKRGLGVIAVLVGTPEWARPRAQERQEWTPPEDYRWFGDFAAAFAQRYQSVVDFYEVWDQPNIYPYWGDQFVDPVAYTRLLREVATRVRSVDDSAWILSAGLAPNVEQGPLNLNEVEYLRQVYRAGGGEFFDIVAAKPYGFESGPDDYRIDISAMNYSRVVMLRRVMEEFGDAGKPIWVVEFGWNSLPADWQGNPSPWGTGPAEVQAQRTAAAIERARQEWPWIGPMIWARLLPPETESDPANGFALLDTDLTPTDLWRALEPRLAGLHAGGVGFHTPDSRSASYSGSWRVTKSGADPGGPGDSVTIGFSGTALDLMVRPGPYWAVWYVSVDGRPSRALPEAGGRSYLVLYDPLGEPRQVTVASGLPFAYHTILVEAQGGWGQWPLKGWLAWREGPGLLTLPWSAIGVGSVVAVLGALLLSAHERLLMLVTKLQASVSEWPEWVGFVVVFAFAGVFWVQQGLGLSIVLGTGLFMGILAWPSWGLALIVCCLPFFLAGKRAGNWNIPMVETIVWVTAASAAIGWLGRRDSEKIAVRLTYTDLVIVGLVLLGLASLPAADLYGVAAYQWRRVILSASGLYLAIRLLPCQRRARARAVVGLLLGGCAVAVWGIAQYVTGSGLIEAAGVGRVRAGYGSPNNLALYLERLIPVAACIAMFSSNRVTRLFCWVAAGGLVLSGVLTQSRGLVLLGMPAALLYVLWRCGSVTRRRWLIPAVMAVLLAALTVGSVRAASLSSGLDNAATMRLRLWRSAFNMIRDQPIMGVGLDNFLYRYRTEYILPEAWQEPDLSHPHNLVLDFWVNLGIGGVALLVCLLACGWLSSERALRSASGWQFGLYLGIQAVLVASVAHGLVDNFFFLVDLSHVLLCYLGLVAGVGDKIVVRARVPFVAAARVIAVGDDVVGG